MQWHAAVMAVGIEGVLALCSALEVINWRRAARGRLTHPAYVGIRLPNPSRSQQAWRAAHRVGVRSAPVFALFNVGVCAALYAAARHGWRLVVVAIGGGGLFVLILLMTGTAYLANRAARAVDDKAGHHPRLPSPAFAISPGSSRPQARLSPRNQAIATWVAALAACGLAAFLLGTIIDGYVLALHEQLVPADQFGFRDESTTACWGRWYPSQKAGFQWFLFSYGPVLVASMAAFISIAVKKRSPVDIWALVLGMVLAVLPFLIAAGVHASAVARATAC